MAFLANKTVNRLNLHYACFALASSGGGVFFGVFLLNAGVALPAVLTAYALINLLRVSLLPVILATGKRVGLRPLVVFGTLALGVQYPILAQVHSIGWALLILCVVTAVGEEFYTSAFHAYFAHVGDPEHRGQQTSLSAALYAVVGIVGPIAGAWALMRFGPPAAFGAVAAVQALSVLPLLGAPNVRVEPVVPHTIGAGRQGFLLFVADGWVRTGVFVVWQIALFVVLRQNFTAYGGALAFASLAAAVTGLLLGRHIDTGRGTAAVWLAFIVVAACIVLRATAATPWLAVVATTAGAMFGCIYVPTLMTAVYNLAKASPCPFRFQLGAQAGWHLGRGVGCAISAALAAIGVSLQAITLLSLVGAVAVLFLLRRYYAGVARA